MGRCGLLCSVVICTHGFKSVGMDYSGHLDSNRYRGESRDARETVINLVKKKMANNPEKSH